jgi:hypothetical protein
MNSNGVEFKNGVEYDLNDMIGEYLVKTFPSKFEIIKPAFKADVKLEVKKAVVKDGVKK